MKKKFLAISLALVMVLALVAACAGDPAPAPAADPVAPAADPAAPAPAQGEAPAPAPAPAGDEVFRVAVQLLAPPNEFHAHMRYLIEREIEEAPDNFFFQIFGSTDANDQIVVLETLYMQARAGEWDAIVISPDNGTLVGPIAAQFYEAGFPVVIINRMTDPPVFTSFVAGDNVGGAIMFAHYVGALLGPEGGTVFESRMTAGTPIDRDRHYNFVETLARYYPQITHIGSAEGGNSAERGYDIGMSAMMAHPVINIIYGHDEFAARGFWQAMQDAGRADEVRLVGFWGGTQALWDEQYADPDIVLRGISYQPAFGAFAIRVMMKILNGEEVARYEVDDYIIFAPHNLEEWAPLAY